MSSGTAAGLGSGGRRVTPHTSLRTRLFLTVAIVLSVAVAASSLLSRRATLVEVHEVVARPIATPPASLEPIAARIKALSDAASPDTGAILGEAARALGRPLLLVRPDGSIVAASERRLSSARVRRGPGEGDLTVDNEESGNLTSIAVRGAAPLSLSGADGAPLLLYTLPEPEGRHSPGVVPLPPWILTTIAIGAIALVMTFALSRRILRPVGELTAAAERMTAGRLGIQVDVRGDDEIARLGGAFNAMSLRLADVERLRRQMVTDVAHELRAPVTNLRCGLEAIQDGLAPADGPGIDALHEETLFLQRLIEDLQDLSLAEAGRLDLRVGSVDVETVVRRAAASSSGGAAAAIPVTVMGSISPIPGDADRLEQVFRNLLSNARRHTPAGGSIAVTIRHEARAAIIEVRDTGDGIHPDHLPHVFDRFYRADPSRARATGGAGLGLAIAKQIVLAHGGSITAASQGVNEGATFTVTLPS